MDSKEDKIRKLQRRVEFLYQPLSQLRRLVRDDLHMKFTEESAIDDMIRSLDQFFNNPEFDK